MTIITDQDYPRMSLISVTRDNHHVVISMHRLGCYVAISKLEIGEAFELAALIHKMAEAVNKKDD